MKKLLLTIALLVAVSICAAAGTMPPNPFTLSSGGGGGAGAYSGAACTASQVPTTFNGASAPSCSAIGNAATATALAANPTDCAGGANVAYAIDAGGNLTCHTITSADIGLGSVTNDQQTKAAVMPNTAPTAGQVPTGNAGNTAYTAQTVSGDCTFSSAGVMTCTKTSNVSFAATATSAAESVLTFTDITTNNASTSKHGFMPKGDGVSTDYYGGDGAQHALPAAGITNPLSAGSVGTNALQVVQSGTGLYQPATNTLGIAANGIDAMRLETVSSGVDYVDVAPGATGNPATVTVGAAGSDTNIMVKIAAKGSGTIQLANANSSQTYLTPGPFNGELVIGSNNSGATNAGDFYFDHNDGHLTIRSNEFFSWSNSTSNPTATKDTGLGRGAAAGQVKPTNGSSGYGKFEMAASVLWFSGSGSPEGAVTAAIGSLYTRTDGGAATTLYVKESGSGNTGWVAK